LLVGIASLLLGVCLHKIQTTLEAKMIKLNFLLNATDFRLSIRNDFCHSSHRLKLEYVSFESDLLADNEVDIVNIFKDSEFILLHLSETDGFFGKFSNKVPNKLYIDIEKKSNLHHISISSELDGNFIKNILPYLALVSSNQLIANFSISFSSNSIKNLINEFLNSTQSTIITVDNFEFSFSSLVLD
jgi:hypothetical protein